MEEEKKKVEPLTGWSKSNYDLDPQICWRCGRKTIIAAGDVASDVCQCEEVE